MFHSKPHSPASLYLPHLDGLRFLAFMLVFVHHDGWLGYIPVLKETKHYTWIGVDLFFALSAYLFARLLCREYAQTGTLSFRKFYLRRVYRIWPAYFVMVSLAVIWFLLHLDRALLRHELVSIVGLFTFTDNIYASVAYFNSIPFCSHLWSIGYEEQFYAVVPLLLWVLLRARPQVRRVVLAGLALFLFSCKGLAIALNAPHPLIWTLPFTHFEAMFLGVMLGMGMLDGILRRIPSGVLLLTGLLLFVGICLLPNLAFHSWKLFLTYGMAGLAALCVLSAVLQGAWLQRAFSLPVLVFLGKRSFGLYLYHRIGNAYAAQVWGEDGPLPALFFTSLALTILLAVVSYAWLEKPFLRLKQRYEVIPARPV